MNNNCFIENKKKYPIIITKDEFYRNNDYCNIYDIDDEDYWKLVNLFLLKKYLVNEVI